MQCPACGREMAAIQTGSVTVEACEGGCGGLWFDQLELRRFDESCEAASEALLDIGMDPAIRIDKEKRLHCPKCADIVMMRILYSPNCDVRVEHCPNCAGHWLEAGELRAIRERNTSEADRKAAVDALFAEKFGAKVAEMQTERISHTGGFHPIYSMLRFVMPGCF